MARLAVQLCSRASMFPPQDELVMPESTPSTDDRQQQEMTWQQQRGFGPAVKANSRKPKRVHFTPVNLKASKDPASTLTRANGEAPIEQEPVLPIVSPSQSSQGKAAVNPPRDSTATPASKPAIATLSQNDASTPQKSPRKSYHSRRKNKRSAMEKKVGTVADSAYVPPHVRKLASVPPHLRKRAAATIAAANKDSTSVANGSSIASVRSAVEQPEKLHSSPNGASNSSRLPPSPPTTPGEPQGQDGARLDANDVEAALGNSMTDAKQEDPKHGNQNYDGWDIPRPDSPPRAPRRENPNFPRTKAPPQKHKWIKQSDIKPQPSLSSSDGGITCNSNSNGDPHYDVKKLVDWNGDWIPPPEQWSARKGHTIRNLGSSVEQWIIGHDDICLTTIDTSSVDFIAENGVCKEIVPEYWILPRIEQMSLGEFWKLMPSRQPSALSDVSVHPPFWERYQEGSTLFVHELPMQDARVDPSDPDNHFAGADLMSCTEVRLSLYFGARRRQERKTIVRQNRPVRDCVPTGPPLPDRRIRPKSNVYFRPVQPADVRGIAEIYNHYVDETIFANEFECRTESQIAARIDAIIAAGLPYLVAIARGNQPRGPQHYVSERIVGYAALDDYCDQSSMYRYTFELELYVHPGYLSQNIASCLLDRLLEMADTSYNARGGYDYKNDSNYLKTGPRRVIKTIMLTVHMEHEVKEKTEDKGKHEGEVAAQSNEQIQDKKKTEGKEELQGKAKVDAYMKSFKFFCCGHIPRIGFKLGKEVDAYFYRHVTSEEIDPHGRPTAAS